MIRIASRRYYPRLFEAPLLVGPAEDAGTGTPRARIETEISASPLLLNDDTEVLQLICRDVTGEKDAEKKISSYICQIEEANRKLAELATTDGMTGLANFRQFSKSLEIEHTRSSRYKSCYALVFFDLDHFKHYNDNNGHPAGDALLKGFGAMLKECARTTDIPARYGGEEFVVLCPETNTSQAMVLAERVRKALAAAPFPGGERQPLGFVSCSVGIASFPSDGQTSLEVLKKADEMLYLSKERGRNQVTQSPG